MLIVELKKEDEVLAKEISRNCEEVISYNEIVNFDGSALIQIVIPLATVLSPLIIKYIENQKVTIKFDGVEISAPKKEIPNILKTINEQRLKIEEK